MGKPLGGGKCIWCFLYCIGLELSGGEFNEFDWRSANFTFCDLTGAELGNLNIRDTELDGVKLDMNQAGQLLMDLGIILLQG
ncbi:MAG: pentapeptide repeat-containing protein [Symbiopectobacterium sp.]